MKKRSIKGQIAVEFLVLIAFVIFSLSALIVILAIQAESIQDSYDRSRVLQIKNIVQSEVNLALISPAVYSRQFILPFSVDGEEYELAVYDDVEVVIEHKGVETVFFLEGNNPPATTISVNSIAKGYNTILKTCDSSTCSINISAEN